MRPGEETPQRPKAIIPSFLTVAQHLCQIGQFRVPLGRQQVLLRVSPYVSGEIQEAEVSKGGAGGSIYLPEGSGLPNLPSLHRSLSFQTHPMFFVECSLF